MTPPRDFTPDELLSALEHNRAPGESDPLLRLGRALADAAPAVEAPDPAFAARLKERLMHLPPPAPHVSWRIALPAFAALVAVTVIVVALPRTTTSPRPTADIARAPASGTNTPAASPTPDTRPPTPASAAAPAPAAAVTNTAPISDTRPPTPVPELPQGDLVLTVRQEKDGPLLTWTPRTTDGFLSYELLRSTTNSEPALTDTKPFATLLKRDATSFVDAAASPKTTYFYRVCSTERGGASWCGNVAKYQVP